MCFSFILPQISRTTSKILEGSKISDMCSFYNMTWKLKNYARTQKRGGLNINHSPEMKCESQKHCVNAKVSDHSSSFLNSGVLGSLCHWCINQTPVHASLETLAGSEVELWFTIPNNSLYMNTVAWGWGDGVTGQWSRDTQSHCNERKQISGGAAEWEAWITMVSRRSGERWLRALVLNTGSLITHRCSQYADTQRLRPEVESLALWKKPRTHPDHDRELRGVGVYGQAAPVGITCWSHISTRCYVRVIIIDGHNTMMSPAGLWSLRLSVFSTVILGVWNWRVDSEI